MKRLILKFWQTNKQAFKADTSNETHKMYLSWISSFLFSIGLTYLIWMFLSLLTTSIGFLLDIPITNYHFPFSIGLTIPILFLLMKKMFRKRLVLYFLINLLIVISCFLFSFKIANSFYDLSYDSQWYHIETVIALDTGWNPFKHQLSPQANADISSQEILNSYPRATEIMETVVYKYVGKIEAAKCINLVIVFMTFSFVLSLLLRIKQLNPLLSIMSSLLVVTNPITLIQYLSFYIDASMYNLLLVLVALLLTFYLTHKNYVLLPLIFCIGILWNVKLTAIIYSTIFFGAFLIFSWYTEQVTLFLKSIQAYIFAIFLSIFILGINPYITNTFVYSNPFHSFKSKSGFLYDNAPESLYYVSSLERFIYSIFSRTANLRAEGKIHQLKLPLTYNKDEVAASKYDNTVGGFGPLFSGAFILSVIGFGFILISKHYNFSRKSVIYLLFVVFIVSVYFPVSSYARYAPIFWIFPSIVALYLLHEKKLLHTIVGIALIAAMLGNNYLISKEYLTYNWEGSKKVKLELQELKAFSQNNTITVDFDLYRSNRIRFKEAGIIFTEKDISSCISNQRRVLSDYIPESKITLCYQ